MLTNNAQNMNEDHIDEVILLPQTDLNDLLALLTDMEVQLGDLLGKVKDTKKKTASVAKLPIVLKGEPVDYVAYNTLQGYNCETYFGHGVQKSEKTMIALWKMFLEKYPEWVLMQIGQMCTNDRAVIDNSTLLRKFSKYPNKPTAAKDGKNCACQIIIYDKKTNEFIELWFKLCIVTSSEAYAKFGLLQFAKVMLTRSDILSSLAGDLKEVAEKIVVKKLFEKLESKPADTPAPKPASQPNSLSTSPQSEKTEEKPTEEESPQYTLLNIIQTRLRKYPSIILHKTREKIS